MWGSCKSWQSEETKKREREPCLCKQPHSERAGQLLRKVRRPVGITESKPMFYKKRKKKKGSSFPSNPEKPGRFVFGLPLYCQFPNDSTRLLINDESLTLA